MSSRNTATLDNNDDYPLNNDGVYVYKGREINEDDKRRIKHVHVHESVSVVDEKAFYYCDKLQTVNFPTNHMIKKIGGESFCWCTNLLSIDLHNTQIESIAIYAFYFCEKLATVQFPGTIQKIERGCFAYCHQLKAVDLSHVNHLESIERYSFYCCYALKTVNLHPTTSCIGKESFFRCEALESVDLRATCVREIGEHAFRSCKNLSNIYFPTTTKCIGQHSFRLCTKLASLNLQATCVERMGDRVFSECINLQTINFPNTLKYIGKYCFDGCDKLEYLTLHETSIEKIGDGAFHNCTNLQTVVGVSTSHQKQLQEIMDDYGSMILPSSLVEIGEDAFSNCPKLRNIINTNWLQYECDTNRGGRRFLQRDPQHHQDNDGDAKRHDKVYYSSLWPLILHRVMNEMKLPRHRICPNDDNLTLYTEADPLQRRASVIFYLLLNGVVADLQSQAQSRN